MKHLLILLLLFLAITGKGQSTDNFDAYADASNLDAAGNWTAGTGIITVYKPASDGEVYPNSSGAEVSAYYDGTFANDQYAEGVYYNNLVGSSYIGLAVRGSGNTYYAWYCSNSASYLGKVISGSWNTIALGNVWTSGDTIRFEAEGTTLRCYINGVLDNSIDTDGQVTDATISSGNPGVSGYNTNNNIRLDSWEGGDFTGGGGGGGLLSGSYVNFIGGDTAKNYIANSRMLHYITTYTPYVPPSGDSLVIVFAETFDTGETGLASLAASELMENWKIMSYSYDVNDEAIYSWGGTHENVWRSRIPANQQHGHQVFIILDQNYDQLYIQYDLLVDDNFDAPTASGRYIGKMPLALSGGSTFVDVYGPGGDYTVLDSTWGWRTMGIWGGPDAGVSQFKTYYYHHAESPYSADQAYWDNSDSKGGMPIGTWRTITQRVILNSPGKDDGVAEVYADQKLVSQSDSLMMQSLTQYNNGTNKIDGAYFPFFMGGSSADYARWNSDIYVDNIVMYYYTPTANSYTTEKVTAGKIIPKIVSDVCVYPDFVIEDETYTATVDTITWAPKWVKKLPSAGCPDVYKYVSASAGSITFEFLQTNPAAIETTQQFGGSLGDESYVEVYQGTGTGGTKLYKFDGGDDGGILPSGSYTVTAPVTFKFHRGNDYNVENIFIKYQ